MTRATHADRPYRSPNPPNTTSRRAPRVPFAVLIISLAVGGMALLLALNTASAANELRRHDLAAKDQGVAAQLQQVQNQVAASAAPGNLGRAARALGMVSAVDPAFLVIEPDGSVRVLGSAGAAPGPVAPAAHTSTKPKSAKSTASTASPKPTKTASKTPTGGRSSRSTGKSTKSSTSPKRSTSPTATPNKTLKKAPPTNVTLPGGNR